jgi:hypothetical protein
MEEQPAAIMDEKGGWSTAFWYPQAPPTTKAHQFGGANTW